MNQFLRGALVLAALFPAACFSQVQNGDFERGGNDWIWSQAVVPGDSSQACFDSMEAFSPRSNYDLFHLYGAEQNGLVAKVSGNSDTRLGKWVHCRQVSQDVYIPPGYVMKFNNKVGLGDLPNQWAGVSTTFLGVSAIDKDSGHEFRLFTKSGAQYYCPGPGSCAAFDTDTVNISAVWGRNVSLRFKTYGIRESLANGKYTVYSTALIDGVVLEKIPVGPLPIKSGSWYNADRSGHGLHFSRAANGAMIAIWYTYLPDGRPVWYISDTVLPANGVWQSQVFKSTWNPATGANSLQPVGDVKIEMTGASSMTFSWDLYSVNGNDKGFDGAEPFSFLFGGGPYTGLWYEPAYSGWGISLEYKDNPQGIDTVATAFYYDGTEPVWAQGAVEGTPTGNKVIEMTQYTGIGLCPECVGQQAQMFPWPAGILSLNLDGGTGWIDAQSHSGNRWQRGSIAQPAGMAQLTGP